MSLAKEGFWLNEPIEFMRFTLFYRGSLHSASRENPRREEKQRLRRYFHKQLADLWETHPAVIGPTGLFGSVIQQWRGLSDEIQTRNWSEDFIHAHDYGQFRFVPFVSNHLYLRCELDILFLRREPPGAIFDEETGDIDNRLKVLFDALRMPKPNSRELPPTDAPLETERPFFCLLEDDKLITRFNVEADRLLDKQTNSDAEVELLIKVLVRTVKLTYNNLGLGGD